jgi:hypothetical protein
MAGGDRFPNPARVLANAYLRAIFFLRALRPPSAAAAPAPNSSTPPGAGTGVPPVVVLPLEVEVDVEVLVEVLVLVEVEVTGGGHDFVHFDDLVLLLKVNAFASVAVVAATDAVAIETPTIAALVSFIYCMSKPLALLMVLRKISVPKVKQWTCQTRFIQGFSGLAKVNAIFRHQ